jgi:hydrogenase maturation factor HypF (carbamoyltransferase family)
MIKAYCDKCEKEIDKNLNTEYSVDIDVKTTGWAGNRNVTYYSRDYDSSNTTRKFFLCGECLNKFNNMVRDFIYPQQKGEIKE